MNFIRIDKDNLVNGPGIRLVLWVSGCNHHCENCHNPESWNKNLGTEFSEETLEYLTKELSSDHYAGLTITGGDPFFPENRSEVAKILSHIKTVLPNKNIWCWTGYEWEKLIPNIESIDSNSLEYRILKNIDVLIDGKFSMEQRKIDLQNSEQKEILKYRGSSNQRIINVQKSLNERRLIENG
jgi:anaerobic ribonucleoside-triphosphate reductase activating protein